MNIIFNFSNRNIRNVGSKLSCIRYLLENSATKYQAIKNCPTSAQQTEITNIVKLTSSHQIKKMQGNSK